MPMRLFFLICLCPALVLSSRSVFGENRDVFRLGLIQSLTGVAQEDASTVRQAVQLAVDEVNASSGDFIHLMLEDDQGLPKNTVSAYQKLKTQGVDAIIASTWSFTTNAIAPLAGRDKLVVVNTSTLPEALEYALAKEYLFNNSLPIQEELEPLSTFLGDKSFKTALVVHNNSLWGLSQSERARKIAALRGIKILEEIPSTAAENNDWQEVIPRIKSKNPELLILFLAKNDTDLILRKTAELNFKPAFFLSKNALDAFAQTKSKPVYEGACFTYPLKQLGDARDFRQAYLRHFGTEPRIYAHNSYDAVFILFKAHKLARQKGTELKDVLRQEEFYGLAGRYRYLQENSLAAGESSLVCIKDGAFKIRH